MRPPSFAHERALASSGFLPIGVDEAGCGCLAGPVVAAAVHLPLDSRLADVRDSKLLSAAQRERLVSEFVQRGTRYAIGIATHEEIDCVNIRQATYLAMRRAAEEFLGDGNQKFEYRNSKQIRNSNDKNMDVVSGFGFRASDFPTRYFALVDAWTIPNLPIPQRGIIHGDRLVKSIAAASIIAKVTRDAMLLELDAQYPMYGFAAHKGYATAAHRAAITTHGMSPVHRKTFIGKLGVGS